VGKSNQLTAKFVAQVTTPGVYRDGLGLLLRVEPSGSKRWVLRTAVNKKRRDLGLGSARDLTLAQVREKAFEMRKAARTGRDPTAEHRQSISFKQAAEKVHAERIKGWRNGKHGAQWLATLKAYAMPVIGEKQVSEILPADVLRVLAPIWLKRPETARRVRQRIGVVLDWAATEGYRSHLAVNAAHVVTRGLPRQPRAKKRHAALPWRDVPAFLIKVRATPSADAVRYALEFLLLTAGRTAEIINAAWSEIDLDEARWTVPAGRMKAGVEHRVPLSQQAVQLLHEVRARWPNSRLVFPGRHGRQPLSNMAMLMLMRRLKVKAVPHGLRSSFRDWASETRQDRDLAEAALAHTLSNKTEAACARSDLFDQRRPLMQAWADFCSGKGVDDAG